MTNRSSSSSRRLVTRGALLLAAAMQAVAPLAASADPLDPTARWTAYARGAAALPPMGWASWNAFNSDIDEEKVLASARIIVDSGLAQKGYRYIDIDDGWWLRRNQPDGRMVIRAAKFPSARLPDGRTSFRPLTDRLHAISPRAASPSARSVSTAMSSRTSASISRNGGLT